MRIQIIEVPVIFINRELGTSKMNSSIFGEAVFGVIKLKWDSWFRKYPSKIKTKKHAYVDTSCNHCK